MSVVKYLRMELLMIKVIAAYIHQVDILNPNNGELILRGWVGAISGSVCLPGSSLL
jgi:hypothetical protein